MCDFIDVFDSVLIIKTKFNHEKINFNFGDCWISYTWSIRNSGQTTQPKLNQVELIKKLIGNWKVVMAKDTVLYLDYKAFGLGFEGNDRTLAKDKKIGEEKELWGYDSKLDKFDGADFVKGKDIEIWVFWFTSNTKV